MNGTVHMILGATGGIGSALSRQLKEAGAQLALAAAATYASGGIRINVVAPGLTKTPLVARVTANEAALNASAAMHPLGRVGEPDDIARAIAGFLDPAQSWVTGQVLGVDGGLSRVRPAKG